MANVNIVISRQDYGTNELNGWEPNVCGSTALKSLTGVAAVTSSDTGIIPADFKDHKTVFYCSAAASATLKFAAGTTYGAQAKDIVVPAGDSIFWLDSTKYADKKTGEVKFTTTASVTVVGYEMR
jgi:hypothetical protein